MNVNLAANADNGARVREFLADSPRMVFTGCNIRESWVRSLLDLLDAEVEDETAQRAAGLAAS